MAFDLSNFNFENFMGSPMTLAGLSLLSGRNVGDAGLMTYKLLAAKKQQEQEARRLTDQEDLQRAQIAQMGKHTSLYEQQIQHSIEADRRAHDEAVRQQSVLDNIARQLPGLFGQQPTQQPPAPSAPPVSQFSNGLDFVFKHEGGYVSNDSNGSPANYGINQAANPDVNVKSLTKDDAAQLYKQRYWDAIGGDQLPPKTALVAFDTAVNMGPEVAKRLLAETQGDPAAIIAKRRDMYKGLAANPGMDRYLNGWNTRMDDLQKQIEQQAPQAPNTAMAPDRSVALGILGAKTALGNVKGGQVIMDLAKLTQPQAVAAGSYQRDPVTGQVQFMPDPYKAAETKFRTGTGGPLGLTGEETAKLGRETAVRQIDTLEKNYTALQDAPSSLVAIGVAKDALAHAGPLVGSFGEKKLEVAKFLNTNIPGFHLSEDTVKNIQGAETLRSALFYPILANLKKLDAQPSEQQQEAMRDAFGRVTTDPNALPLVLDMYEKALRSRVGEHNKRVKQAADIGLPFSYDMSIALPTPSSPVTYGLGTSGVSGAIGGWGTIKRIR